MKKIHSFIIGTLIIIIMSISINAQSMYVSNGHSSQSINGIYTYGGEHNSKPYYSMGGTRFLYHSGSSWSISDNLGTAPPIGTFNYLVSSAETPAGLELTGKGTWGLDGYEPLITNGNMELTGAHSGTDVNGVYVGTDMLNGKPFYTKVAASGDFYLYWTSGGFWNCGRNLGSAMNNLKYYYVSSNADTPDGITFTDAGGMGVLPAPTVGQSALPVELIFFSAGLDEDNVRLNWKTVTETNNYGFEVERRLQVGEWNVVGFVPGNGNSNSPKSYEFIDENAPSEELEYRLKQIDTDGRFEYYNLIAKVDANSITSLNDEVVIATFRLEQNYPNPFNPVTTIQYHISSKVSNGRSKVSLKIYDVLGHEIVSLVDEYQYYGNYQVEFDAYDLPSGTYFYRLIADENIVTKKMVLIK